VSIIDNAPEANRNYAKRDHPTLGKPPTPKIAVVICIDARLSDLPRNPGSAASRANWAMSDSLPNFRGINDRQCARPLTD
jgi:hypothetical protein